MKTIKKIKEDNRGSILILVILALVGAISIAVAMSSISIVERKITTKSRKSTTAFQAANSGIEWAMKKINDAGPSDKIGTVFGTPDNDGKVNCPSDELFSSNSGLECKITLLKRNASGQRELITDENTLMEDIEAIRSAGTFGTSTEQVGRALEAYAMPNCGSGTTRVADFCIDDNDSPSEGSWGGAVTICQGGGQRLCTASELVAANQAGVTINNLMSADVTGNGEYAVVDGGSVSSVSDGTSEDFRCCRNR